MTQNPKILHFFTYISSTSTPFQKHFTSLYRATLVLHFMFWLLRRTVGSPTVTHRYCVRVLPLYCELYYTLY